MTQKSETKKPVEEDGSPVKDFFRGIFNWFLRYPIALVISVGVIVLGAVALALGWGDAFNAGGLIAKLFGKDRDDAERVTKANEKAEDRSERIDEPDDRGMTQREVEVLETSKNPFRDRKKLKIKDPDSKEERIIKLPEGVKDKDVDKVYEVRPDVYEIKVKERPEGRVTDRDLEYLE